MEFAQTMGLALAGVLHTKYFYFQLVLTLCREVFEDACTTTATARTAVLGNTQVLVLAAHEVHEHGAIDDFVL